MANLKIVISAVSKGLAGVAGKFKSMASGIAGSFKSVMSSPFGMLLGGGSAIGAARGLVGFIDKLDGIGKAAKRVGISAEAFQKLSFAARRSGAGVEQLEMAFKQMSVVITDAASGSATANGFLAKLGVTLDQLSGKSPEQQFEVLADALAKVEDHTEKAYLAQRIFSEGGLKLLPMIANYRALGDEIKRLGGIIDNETIEAAERAADAMENIKVRAAGAAGRTGMVDFVDQTLKGFNDNLRAIDESDAGGFVKTLAKGGAFFEAGLGAIFGDQESDRRTAGEIKKQVEAFKKAKDARLSGASSTGASSEVASRLGLAPTGVDSLRAIGANAAGSGASMDLGGKLDRQTAVLEEIRSSLSPQSTMENLARQRRTRATDGAKP